MQRVRAGIEPLGDSRPDWEILCDLARRRVARGSPPAADAPLAGWNYAHLSEIMDEIAALTPIYGGIRYDRIEEDGLQLPCPTAGNPGRGPPRRAVLPRRRSL